MFLGTRECQAFVEPEFQSGQSYYDDIPGEIAFWLCIMALPMQMRRFWKKKNKMTINFWRQLGRGGVIEFIRPEQCKKRT